MMDPFVSLMAAAVGDPTLQLCTGICLVLEHDLLDLACTVATLDVLSGGRVLLGIGVGWNEEELANHRPDVPFAPALLGHARSASPRCARSGPRRSPAFDGRWEPFSAVVGLPEAGSRARCRSRSGNAGPVGIRHAAEYADQWCPIDASLLNTSGRPDVAGGVQLFRRARRRGRAGPGADPDHDLRRRNGPSRPASRHYAELGVERVVLPPPSMSTVDAAATLRYLDSVADTVAELGQPA